METLSRPPMINDRVKRAELEQKLCCCEEIVEKATGRIDDHLEVMQTRPCKSNGRILSRQWSYIRKWSEG